MVRKLPIIIGVGAIFVGGYWLGSCGKESGKGYPSLHQNIDPLPASAFTKPSIQERVESQPTLRQSEDLVGILQRYHQYLLTHPEQPANHYALPQGPSFKDNLKHAFHSLLDRGERCYEKVREESQYSYEEAKSYVHEKLGGK